MEQLTIPLAEIQVTGNNPRTLFDEEALLDLTESIRTLGLQQPVSVRRMWTACGGGGTTGVRYELISGERRLRAAQRLGWTEIPAVVQDLAHLRQLSELAAGENPIEALEPQLMLRRLDENLKRASLSPLEEGQAYLTLTDLGVDVDDLARRIGLSPGHVYARMKLLELGDLALDALRTGWITPGHADVLVRLTPEQQQEMMGVLALQSQGDGILSVKALREYARDRFGEKTETPAASGASAPEIAVVREQNDDAGEVCFHCGGEHHLTHCPTREYREPETGDPVAESQAEQAREDAAEARAVDRARPEGETARRDGPVPDAAQASGQQQTVDEKLETETRREIARRILAWARENTGLAVRHYAAEMLTFNYDDYPEEFAEFRALLGRGNQRLEQIVQDVLSGGSPEQLAALLWAVELSGYLRVSPIHPQRSIRFTEYANMVGVDVADCEAAALAALAGVPHPEKKSAATPAEAAPEPLRCLRGGKQKAKKSGAPKTKNKRTPTLTAKTLSRSKSKKSKGKK